MMVFSITEVQVCRLFSSKEIYNMKFTIKQIDRCAAELQKLQNSKKHWPVKVNYAIAKNLKRYWQN